MVFLKVTDIEWDDGNREKCQKHGVSTEEIEYMFLHTHPETTVDEKHSLLEQRYLAIGQNKQHRYMFVVFTFRVHKGIVFIRPLSARYMHKKEIAAYGKENTAF